MAKSKTFQLQNKVLNLAWSFQIQYCHWLSLGNRSSRVSKVLKRLAKQLHIQGLAKYGPRSYCRTATQIRGNYRPVLQTLLRHIVQFIEKRKKTHCWSKFVPKTERCRLLVEVQSLVKPVVRRVWVPENRQECQKEALAHIAEEAKKKDQPKDKSVSRRRKTASRRPYLATHVSKILSKRSNPQLPELFGWQQTLQKS